MALKGISLGLEVQDYMNDKISNKQMPSGLNEINLSKENFDLFIDEHGVDLPPEDTKDLYINEYVYLRYESDLEIARYHGDGQLEALIIGDSMGIKIPKGIRVQPLNLEQRMLMDALLDEDIKLITCRGKAGTGNRRQVVTGSRGQFGTVKEQKWWKGIPIGEGHHLKKAGRRRDR